MRGKRLLESDLVDFQTLLAGKFDGQIERKPVRVVKPEDLATWQDLGNGLSLRRGIARQILDQRLKTSHARAQRASKGLLFVRQDFLDLHAAVA